MVSERAGRCLGGGVGAGWTNRLGSASAMADGGFSTYTMFEGGARSVLRTFGPKSTDSDTQAACCCWWGASVGSGCFGGTQKIGWAVVMDASTLVTSGPGMPTRCAFPPVDPSHSGGLSGARVGGRLGVCSDVWQGAAARQPDGTGRPLSGALVLATGTQAHRLEGLDGLSRLDRARQG